jgi:hypothetical protein
MPYNICGELMIRLLQVLTSLIVSYLSPDTADNQELRQCLAYFFPVYCYSSPINQRRMHKVLAALGYLATYPLITSLDSLIDVYADVSAAVYSIQRARR